MRFYEIAEAILDPKKAAKYTKPITIPKALAIAQTHCSDALNTYLQTGKSLYKGLDNFYNNFYAMDSSQIARRSQNTTNIYTIFTSQFSKEWKQYPPRERSFICSTSTRYAGNYGTVFCIFPENGTNIGICPSYDMWDSFNKGNIDSLGGFANFINFAMFRWAKSEGMLPRDASRWDYDKNKLDKFVPEFLKQPLFSLHDDSNNPKGDRSGAYSSYTDFYKIEPIRKKYKGNITVGEYLEMALSPSKNGFSLVTPDKIANVPDTDSGGYYGNEGHECWFSGRCVIANKDALDSLIKQGKFK